MSKIQEKLIKAAPTALFVLLILQPILDVASYWANRANITSLTTFARFFMFAAVVAYSFVISRSKKRTLLAYGVMALFFALHFAACLREGGYGMFSDTANFLRIAQLPVFTFCFIDVFEANPKAKEKIPKAMFVILCVILCVIALSFAVGLPEYTYGPEKTKDGLQELSFGFKGWFEVSNAQSAIIVLVVPMVLYYAAQKKRSWFFLIAALLSFGNLYLFGTRYAYYSIFIIGLAFAAAMLVSKQKKKLPYLFLAVILLANGLLYTHSAMYRHRFNYNEIMGDRQTVVDNNIQKVEQEFSGVHIDQDHLFPPETEEPQPTESTENPDQSSTQETPPPTTTVPDPSKQAAENAMRDVYLNLYQGYCKDMIDNFGMSRVVAIYNGTKSVFTLSDQRLRKINFAKLAWQDANFDCKLFGYQYNTLISGDNIYDLENDFQGTFYFVGYVGMALFIVFLAYFVLRALVTLIRSRGSALTMEFCVVCVTLVMILLAAQFSGNVIRRPNASIYFSLFLAYLYYLTGKLRSGKKEREE